MTAQRDDQGILAPERLNERLRLAVIDLLGNHAFGQLALAVDSRECRDGVLAGLEQGFGHEAAAVAASLRSVSR